MTRSGRLALLFRRAALVPLFFLCVLALLCVGILLSSVYAQTTSPGQQPPATGPAPGQSLNDYVVTHVKDADTHIEREIDALKDRAGAQQNLITGLTSLTSLYVVILSLAAYFRLQQTRDESEKSIESTKSKMDDFIQEVRSDIPAVHGIGRKLEGLLADLGSRMSALDWTRGSSFANLDDDHLQQALIDEMVVNSLDIFNVKQDLNVRKTVSGLFYRLGQFYLSRASFLRSRELTAYGPVAARPARAPGANLHDSVACLSRARIYFDKAIDVDDRNPIALRARGVVEQHVAQWKKQDDYAPRYDPGIFTASRLYIRKSLAVNPNEPGALFADAWLLANSDPSDCKGAIAALTKVIQYAPALSDSERRKYLYPAYLNRADYNARLARVTSGSHQQTHYTNIIADVENALKTSTQYQLADTFKQDLRDEIAPGGDLTDAYRASPTVKAAIDKALT